MSGRMKFTTCSAALLFLFVVGQAANAQTPAQLEYERQQREYARQQEQQRQEQQRQQQIMQENARRQQDELNRSIRATTPSSSAPTTPNAASPSTGSASRPSLPAAASEDPRRTWEKQPPMLADRNPLLGKWTHFGPKTPSFLRDSWDQRSIQACDALFADNWYVEFLPTTIVIVGHDRRWRPLAEVTYRGGDKRVAILPKVKLQTVPDVIVVDITSPVKAQLINSECKMGRIGDFTAGGGR